MTEPLDKTRLEEIDYIYEYWDERDTKELALAVGEMREQDFLKFLKRLLSDRRDACAALEQSWSREAEKDARIAQLEAKIAHLDGIGNMPGKFNIDDELRKMGIDPETLEKQAFDALFGTSDENPIAEVRENKKS